MMMMRSPMSRILTIGGWDPRGCDVWEKRQQCVSGAKCGRKPQNEKPRNNRSLRCESHRTNVNKIVSLRALRLSSHLPLVCAVDVKQTMKILDQLIQPFASSDSDGKTLELDVSESVCHS